MAYHGILHCHASRSDWFGGIVCTDGGGSARTGRYADFTSEQMRETRRTEQEAAAALGRYGALIQLMYPSEAVKQSGDERLTNDLLAILEVARPRVVYAHNPADKHETHVAVFCATIAALRRLPSDLRPEKIYGCEVWRDLDWMIDAEKMPLDVGGNDSLATQLNTAFESQIVGGKRYDLAVMGRRRANATFFKSHATDRAEMLSFAMDLTPLVADPGLDVEKYVAAAIDRFRNDVTEKIARQFRR